MTALIEMAGQKFGRLTVVRRSGTSRKKAVWHCECDCGQSMETKGTYLRAGITKSCGCLQRELLSERRTKHGATRKNSHWPEYGIWFTMINRCYRPEADSYKYYGARGIYVCDRWRDGEGCLSGFECFIADMGRRPHANLSIDRINNDGPYAPGNCRWATGAVQRLNQRPRQKKEATA